MLVKEVASKDDFREKAIDEIESNDLQPCAKLNGKVYSTVYMHFLVAGVLDVHLFTEGEYQRPQFVRQDHFPDIA